MTLAGSCGEGRGIGGAGGGEKMIGAGGRTSVGAIAARPNTNASIVHPHHAADETPGRIMVRRPAGLCKWSIPGHWLRGRKELIDAAVAREAPPV